MRRNFMESLTYEDLRKEYEHVDGINYVISTGLDAWLRMQDSDGTSAEEAKNYLEKALKEYNALAS
jgi:hypothetical protein